MSLQNRGDDARNHRILVSLGMTDTGGHSAPIVESLVARPCDSAIDIVLSQRAPSYSRVQALARLHPNISVHENPACMAALMRDADLALGAGGTSAWERCCMGLPSIMLVVAGNQRDVAASLEKLGAAIVIADPSEAGDTVAALIDDREKLAAMSVAAAQSTDGAGALRMVDELIRITARPEARRA